MAKHKHLTLEDRFMISNLLDKNYSFKKIGTELGKDCTTISKEIRKHIVFKKTGSYGYPFNACLHRFSCDVRMLCSPCSSGRNYHFCKFCKSCNAKCPDFEQELCKRHSKPPYVCNACEKLKSCTLEKHFYHASDAYYEYKNVLSESRSGISLSEGEIKRLDGLVSPLIMRKQSLNHICANNKDTLMVSESTLYRLVDYNLFSARNIDLPRKVRYKPRRLKKNFKVDKACRVGRTLEDFQKFMEEHPDLPVTQMDSVEGRKGGKVLLTIHFVKPELMLAFIRDFNDSQSVIDVINQLYLQLQLNVFATLMPVLLGDNGSEFSNPDALEFDSLNNRRTHVFYCDPSSPYQKGSAERNHEFIRMFIPKGESMDALQQEDITLMMNHINSYSRESLGNKCPYEVFSFLYGKDILKQLGCTLIPADEVTLNPSIFAKERSVNG